VAFGDGRPPPPGACCAGNAPAARRAFAGDALGPTPLTGLAAAGGALRALAQGGGFLVDRGPGPPPAAAAAAAAA